MMKMIHIQILIHRHYSGGGIRHELREWKNVKKNMKNMKEKKQSMSKNIILENIALLEQS